MLGAVAITTQAEFLGHVPLQAVPSCRSNIRALSIPNAGAWEPEGKGGNCPPTQWDGYACVPLLSWLTLGISTFCPSPRKNRSRAPDLKKRSVGISKVWMNLKFLSRNDKPEVMCKKLNRMYIFTEHIEFYRMMSLEFGGAPPRAPVGTTALHCPKQVVHNHQPRPSSTNQFPNKMHF